MHVTRPQGIAWDAGGRLFASEFGGSAFDEVNSSEAGKNHGRPTLEGTGRTPAFVNPLVTRSIRASRTVAAAPTA